jgi:H/ACA ribonucleoprotein complex subunit 3
LIGWRSIPKLRSAYKGAKSSLGVASTLRFRMRKCPKCGVYTLQERCKKCGGETVLAHPAKFSPDDKYALYKVKWD